MLRQTGSPALNHGIGYSFWQFMTVFDMSDHPSKRDFFLKSQLTKNVQVNSDMDANWKCRWFKLELDHQICLFLIQP